MLDINSILWGEGDEVIHLAMEVALYWILHL